MLHRIKHSESDSTASSRGLTDDIDVHSLSASVSTLTVDSVATSVATQKEDNSQDGEKEKRPRHSRHLSIQNLVRGTSRSRSRGRNADEADAELHEQRKKEKRKKKEKEDELAHWLQKGNVIYKSVGLGLTDLTVGMQLVDLAEQKGVGNHISAF